MQMTDRKYPLSYFIDRRSEGWTKPELLESGAGGCDAVVIGSILRGSPENRPHEGCKNIAIISGDGRTDGPIPDTELFQVMATIALDLLTRDGIPPWQRKIATMVRDSVRREMSGS